MAAFFALLHWNTCSLEQILSRTNPSLQTTYFKPHIFRHLQLCRVNFSRSPDSSRYKRGQRREEQKQEEEEEEEAKRRDGVRGEEEKNVDYVALADRLLLLLLLLLP
jgi:hypothetical protein